MFTRIKFFEGELRLIAELLALRGSAEDGKAAPAEAFLGERGNRYDTREYCTQEFRRNRGCGTEAL